MLQCVRRGRSRRTQSAQQLYEVMVKKFRESCKVSACLPTGRTQATPGSQLAPLSQGRFRRNVQVWMQYVLFLLRQKADPDGARKVLQRSLKSLPKRKRTLANAAPLDHPGPHRRADSRAARRSYAWPRGHRHQGDQQVCADGVQVWRGRARPHHL